MPRKNNGANRVIELDEIDSIIVEGLQDYVNVSNAALKSEREDGKFILGGQFKATPKGNDYDRFEETLSLGMAALNESNAENLAAPIPDSPINREIHSRLVNHFMGRSEHGLRSALATMGLETEERPAFRKKEITNAIRAADRALEIISGRQASAGYPMTGGIQLVGGHLVGRATSKGIGYPEQILHRNNMETEGGLEGQVRHEYRGAVAANKLKNKFIEELVNNPNGQETLRIVDALTAVNNSKG